MQAYEFSTRLTENGYLRIPEDYAQEIPQGSALRVIVLVEEPIARSTNGKANGPNLADAASSLAELIARIQSKPSDPANIKPGNMRLLAERLAHPVTESDPAFDSAAWDQQWAQLEAEMDATEEEEEQSRLRDLVQ